MKKWLNVIGFVILLMLLASIRLIGFYLGRELPLWGAALIIAVCLGFVIYVRKS
jgi:cytosine/uracil/thiamine/allantoin permease